MEKIVFNFSQVTGEFIHACAADKSPLDDGLVYLLPAFATEIAPPKAGMREVAVFAGDHWEVFPDWRGVPLYSVVDGAPVSIDKIGDTPDRVQGTELPCPSMDHTWTNGKWKLDQARQKSRLAASAIRQRDALLAAATAKIAPLQDAVDLDDASTAEIALLKQWKQYRVALNRIESQTDFPEAIVWPSAPGA